MAMNGYASIYFDQALELYDLPPHKAKPQAVRRQNPLIFAGIDPTKIKLAVTAQATQSADELIRLAAKPLRYLTESEQHSLDRALFRSVKIVHKGKLI